MAQNEIKLKIVAKQRIKKFAEGVDPKTGTPYEVLENEEVLVGQDALNYLNSIQDGGNA